MSLSRWTILLALGLAAAGEALVTRPSLASQPSRDARLALQRGTAAYLEARYAAALPDLEEARDAGATSGSLLYMLGFCYDSVSHDPEASTRAYDAALEMLEKEIQSKSPPLDSFFYLTNLHQVRKRLDQAKTVAEAAVGAIEGKRTKVAKDGVSQFRAGKLYADSGKAAQAVEYHRRALAAFSKSPSPPPEYHRRSTETVARADLGKGDPQAVSNLWEELLAVNPQTPDGDWSLGLAALRAGRYAVARDAFQRARRTPGDRAEDAFYSSGLAGGALELVNSGQTIPSRDMDGKSIGSLDTEEIDRRIKEHAKKASEIISRKLNPGEYTIVLSKRGKKIIAPLEGEARGLADVQRYFVALVSELVLRGLPLQTTAFQGGYAPLVLQDWNKLWRNAHRDIQEEIWNADGAPSPD